MYKKDGVIHHTRFTKGRLYHEGGVRRLAKNTRRWERCVKDEQDYLNCFTSNTSSLSHHRAHVAAFRDVYDALWSERTKMRWARGRFGTHIRKSKAMDTYFRELKVQGVTRAFLGHGSWSPTMPGTETTPVDWMAKKFLRYHKRLTGGELEAYGFMVDEYLTTQCCYRCLSRCIPVFKRGHLTGELDVQGRKKREDDVLVKGLLFCDSRTCGCLNNRDFQGAMNVGACGVAQQEGQPRSIYLTSQTPASKRSDKYLLKNPATMRVRG